MSEILTSLPQWFSERPKWLQEAAMRLPQHGDDLADKDITEMAAQCQKEANGTLLPKTYSFPVSAFSQGAVDPLHLCSISNVEGVNALAPNRTLKFGEGNITVVYGNNGSGKSGYVRLLKHICGAREPGTLLHNVYKPAPAEQKACISFKQNGEPKKHEWLGPGICDNLNGVDIFDASFGKVFVSSEEEMCYEPPILLFFSSLIDVCEKVATALNAEKNKHQSQKPNMPIDKQSTPEGIWYKTISAQTISQDIDKYCTISSAEEIEMQALQKRIDEKAPAEEAKRLRGQKNHADILIQDAQKHLEQISDDNCQQIIAARKDAVDKKVAADITAKKIFSTGKLEGIGSDVWKNLWEAARKYSVEDAYKAAEYPNVSENSFCVLCHQTLDQDAKDRLRFFESFVKNEMQKIAIEAANKYKATSQSVDELPTQDSLKTKIDAASITQEETVSRVMKFFTQLQDRKDKLLGNNPEEAILSPLPSPKWIEDVNAHSKKLNETAAKYDDDAKKDNRVESQKTLSSLQARKWLSENIDAVNKEINRLTMLSHLEQAKLLADTTALSRKKGHLAKALITEAFEERFKAELNALGASQVKVNLSKKTKVTKGQVLHKIQLQDVPQSALDDILSEGERQIVSIAAFLADVTAKESRTPFIFDDPISSLDQNHEEAVAQKLIELSQNRQVIVFTHRLSLLGAIRLFADREKSIKLNVVSIRSSDGNTGEPVSMPLSHKDIKTVLNILIEQRLEAKKAADNGTLKNEKFLLKAMCSEFRILVERSIENDLLCGIVQRFQRPVHTLKVKDLAKLKSADCDFLDLLMSEYSNFEHSQPEESPGNQPTLDKLGSDMNKLKSWREEYNKRLPPTATR